MINLRWLHRFVLAHQINLLGYTETAYWIIRYGPGYLHGQRDEIRR